MAIRIAIDPGHSRSTPGKRSGDFYEYKSNRNIAKKLYKILDDAGFNPFYTVALESVYDMPLSQRAQVAKAKNANALVSIHSNAHSDPRAKGTETFIHTHTEASKPFANHIHRELVKELGTYDRGVKRADFGILRNSYKSMLCCLTEGEFFTTPKTREWMLTEDYEDKYARGVAKGLCKYYDIPYPEPVKVYPLNKDNRLGEVELLANLNYRREPSLDSEVIKVLPKGYGKDKPIHLYEVKDHWLRLGQGWVSNKDNKYVKVKLYEQEDDVYRVIIDGKQVGAYKEYESIDRQIRKAIESGKGHVKVEKV